MSSVSALLDNPAFVTSRDPKGMYALAVGFPEQCRAALRIAESTPIGLDADGVRQVVLTGLGGSAAGGDFARALFEAEAKVPFSVNRDYALPGYVGPDTLVFATSYSGNTEETLSAYADARRRGARIVVVTSGGELARRAAADEVPVITIPGGQPPRTAMGFMLVPVLVAAAKLGLLPAQDIAGAAGEVESASKAWRAESPTERERGEASRARAARCGRRDLRTRWLAGCGGGTMEGTDQRERQAARLFARAAGDEPQRDPGMGRCRTAGREAVGDAAAGGWNRE